MRFYTHPLLTLDCELALHTATTFTHGDQPKSALYRSDIEADALVPECQVDAFCAPNKFDPGMSRTAVQCYVPQAIPHDPIKAERDFGRKRSWYIFVLERDLEIIELGELPANTLDSPW